MSLYYRGDVPDTYTLYSFNEQFSLIVLPGFGNVCGNAIVNHMHVAKIAFTGSTAVGKKIAAAAAQSNLKRVSLELGGKSPVIILPDMDIKTAASGAFFAITFNAGKHKLIASYLINIIAVSLTVTIQPVVTCSCLVFCFRLCNAL
jgi:hypothetical protein